MKQFSSDDLVKRKAGENGHHYQEGRGDGGEENDNDEYELNDFSKLISYSSVI